MKKENFFLLLQTAIVPTPGMLAPGACETPHPRPRTVSAFLECSGGHRMTKDDDPKANSDDRADTLHA